MLKLLVIDDDLPLCDYLKEFFSKKDYEVFTATDGEKGLSIVRDERPNIILLDVVIMPGQFGLDILKEIKKIDNKVKIIMLTSVEDKGIIELAHKYGASDYITKPFDLENLERDVMPKIIRQLV
ncbi:response regulator [Candidatus Omnitrophota bacterium]